MVCLDATGGMKKSFLPVVENMTVATKDVGRPKPNKLASDSPLGYQLRHNAIYVRSKRKAAYKFAGDVLNKARHGQWLGSIHVDQTRCSYLSAHLLLGDCVLSLCSGSGSMMQACMETGRSCVAMEINGVFFFGS